MIQIPTIYIRISLLFLTKCKNVWIGWNFKIIFLQYWYYKRELIIVASYRWIICVNEGIGQRAAISLFAVARRSVCLFEETRLVFHAYFRSRYFCRCSLRRCYEPRFPASSPRLLINLFPTLRNAKQNGMTEAKAEKGEKSRVTRSQRRGKMARLRIWDSGWTWREMGEAGRNKNTGVPPNFPVSFFLSVLLFFSF